MSEKYVIIRDESHPNGFRLRQISWHEIRKGDVVRCFPIAADEDQHQNPPADTLPIEHFEEMAEDETM
jgi:hypothetical protein